MKTQFIFFVVIIALNLTITLGMSLTDSDGNPLIAGMGYAKPVNGTASWEDFDQYNSTDIMDTWQTTPFVGVPIVGDLFTQANQLQNLFGFMIDGVPSLITWTGSMIPTAQGTFTLIAWVVRIISGIMFVTLMLEVIGGRELLP